MKRLETSIPDLVLLEPTVFADDRGWFYEAYQEQAMQAFGIPHMVQANQSFSKPGVVRGLHFQLEPHAQGKLVRCLRGKLWDVAVDIRKSSPTFLKWFGVELSADNKRQLYIPVGFAHGFCALEECEMLYLCTSGYNKASEGSIRYDDPTIGIEWPKINAILSQKDAEAPLLGSQTYFQ